MSELIAFPLPSGPNYTIPDVGDENWGQNVTNFLVALPLGVPPTAGTFTLTGDLSFGASFGIISKYLISTTINPSATGQLRLSKTDTLSWRNNLNSADLPLGIDGSDNLTFNGLTIQFNGTVNAGTANQLAYYPASSNAVSGLTSITASRALVSNASGLPVASTVTTTELSYVSGVTSSIQTQLNTLSSEIGAGSVPTGTMLDFAGSSAPTGYLLCDGTAVSRTTYADLFSVIGIIWGAGDTTTTFNIPDFRRTVAVGSGGSGTGTLGNAVGNTGGTETVTLTAAQIPSGLTVTDPGHNHTQNAHGHAITDPGHQHNIVEGDNTGVNNRNFTTKTADNSPYGQTTDASITNITVNSTTATNNSNTTGISVSGGGLSHNNLQPSAIVTKIIKI